MATDSNDNFLHPAMQSTQNVVFNGEKIKRRLKELKTKEEINRRLDLSKTFMIAIIQNNPSIDPNDAAVRAVSLADALVSTLHATQEVRDKINNV